MLIDQMRCNLESFKVGSVPDLYYLPDYVSVNEEIQLLKEITSSKQAWVQLSGRSCQNIGGMVHEKGLIPAPIPSYLKNLMNQLDIDSQQIRLYGDQPPNHVLINKYGPGDGIMPHQDGPAYYPGVSILSLGAPAVMTFTPKWVEVDSTNDTACTQQEESIFLLPRSLLLFKSEAYTAYLHGIAGTNKLGQGGDNMASPVCNLHLIQNCETLHTACCGQALISGKTTGTRFSLTVRRVPRLIKSLLPNRR
ncbi:hypothetical protein CEUSTIGMA_g7449.t1 [Chlamydomonas eustigma]|uniref:Fe2OG dioxygenase domain-containing protein n=1 Tax=Chlamydomonas eustigma TaxID=1157962 RepID=A0A250XB66_9CHLO|nr:hypothetical protein CEUSTIGMA_g7449.t1 [Chlamydomonas eustigma]|eukprot:GAX80010.1 hypothetical protein CEUSTIGMA_g7449.t1 [Chlamydomonas eustigma]